MKTTATKQRGAFAALWAHLFAAKQAETALQLHNEQELQAARDDVDAALDLAPSAERAWAPVPIERARLSRTTAIAMVLAGGAVVAGVGATMQFGKEPKCFFDDGTSMPGACIFVDEFHTFDAAKWFKEANMVSALLEHGAPWGCERPENVDVVSDELQLTMSDNLRASCPQSWSPSVFYNANILPAGFVAPAATNYDTAAVSMKTCKFQYGHATVNAKMPAGVSPWGAILLWGENCQAGGAMNGLMQGIFNHTGPCDWPQPGATEFDMPSYVWAQAGHKEGIAALHVAAGLGAPFLRNYTIGGLSIPYYGSDWAPTVAIPGYQPYITDVDFGDLSLAFHDYDLIWVPGQFTFLVDGQIAARSTAPWVTRDHMFMQIWNVDNSPIASGLPQTMRVKHVRIVCPPGVPCDWSGCG